MSKTAKRDSSRETPQSDEECQAAIRAMFADMERIDAQMDQRRDEINRLKAETRVMLKDIKRLTNDPMQKREQAEQDQETRRLRQENQRLRSELGIAPGTKIL